jgi:ammonia channel protein AmtB
MRRPCNDGCRDIPVRDLGFLLFSIGWVGFNRRIGAGSVSARGRFGTITPASGFVAPW